MHFYQMVTGIFVIIIITIIIVTIIIIIVIIMIIISSTLVKTMPSGLPHFDSSCCSLQLDPILLSRDDYNHDQHTYHHDHYYPHFSDGLESL